MKTRQREEQESIDRELEKIKGNYLQKWLTNQNQKTLALLPEALSFSGLIKGSWSASELEGITFDDYFIYYHSEKITQKTPFSEFKKTNPRWSISREYETAVETDFDHLRNAWTNPNEIIYSPSKQYGLLRYPSLSNKKSIYREYNFETNEWVLNGFYFLSEAEALWHDNNSILLIDHFNIRYCKRKQLLKNSKILFSADMNNRPLETFCLEYNTHSYLFISNRVNENEREFFILNPNLHLYQIFLPRFINDVYNVTNYFFFLLTSDWKKDANTTYKMGSCIAISKKSLVLHRNFDISIVFEPTASTAFKSIKEWGKFIILRVFNYACTEVYLSTYENNKWILTPLDMPKLGKINVIASHKDSLLLTYQNFITPSTLYYYNVQTHYCELLKTSKSYFESTNLIIKQYFTLSRDGTLIPYFVIKNKNVIYDGNNPTILYGYGGFSYALTPFYLYQQGRWVEQGGIYVVANIRGGNEFGPSWHQAILKENKQKTFDDFIAVIEDLIKLKITSPKKLGINGCSNGGLLVGAVMTQRPELFSAVVGEWPLLDMLNFHKYFCGHYWTHEYGNPDDQNMEKVLSKYSPYHQVKSHKKYPPTLFFSSSDDNTVHPLHARKMVDKMQKMGYPTNYYEFEQGGHSAGNDSKVYKQYNNLELRFFKKQLMDPPSPKHKINKKRCADEAGLPSNSHCKHNKIS